MKSNALRVHQRNKCAQRSRPRAYRPGRVLIGRLPSGADLIRALEDLCTSHRITTGFFSLIGAVSSAKLKYYRQDVKTYVAVRLSQQRMEIVCCSGNISLLDNRILVHAHAIFADRNGHTCGGHIADGTRIFAAEYVIQEVRGALLRRRRDLFTGLNLWPEEPGSRKIEDPYLPWAGTDHPLRTPF